MIKPSISRISESAITLSWKPKISLDIHAMVIALDKSISSFPFLGWIENVPAYHTLTVYFNPIAFLKFQNWEEKFSEYIDELLISLISIIKSEQKVFEIPVKYHPSVAPDLLLASEILQIDIQTIIDLPVDIRKQLVRIWLVLKLRENLWCPILRAKDAVISLVEIKDLANFP